MKLHSFDISLEFVVNCFDYTHHMIRVSYGALVGKWLPFNYKKQTLKDKFPPALRTAYNRLWPTLPY